MVSTICQQHSAFPWICALQLSTDTKLPFCSPQPSASPYWKEEQSKDHVISTVIEIPTFPSSSYQDRVVLGLLDCKKRLVLALLPTPTTAQNMK